MLLRIVLAIVVLVLAALGGGFFYVRQHPLAVFHAMERRALKTAGFEKKSLETSEGKMVYWEKGSGRTLILIHGAGDQAGTWSKVAPQFAASFRVIVPDLPGHGESAPATGPLLLGAEVGGISALVSRANAGKVALVGDSMGAWVALLYGYQHPENVERVVAVNGGPYSINSTYNLKPSTREEARKVMASLQDPGSPAIPDFVLDDIVRTSHSGPIGRLTQQSQEAFVLDGKLGNLPVPVDILWGQADKMLGEDYAKRLASDIPASRLTFIPRCGHVPQRECPLTFTTKLQEILSSPAPKAKLGSVATSPSH